MLPMRITKYRRKAVFHTWVPSYTAAMLIYILPWMVFAVYAKPDILYWLPALGYLIFNSIGYAIRQNHFIPIIPWIVLSGIPGWLILTLIAVDLMASGFYLGDIWDRFYPWMVKNNKEAEQAGKWLRDKEGTIWVNGLHSGIYIHARKPILYGMAEQVEIRENSHERRERMLNEWKANPPDWVVLGEGPSINFNGKGYKLEKRFGNTVIFGKEGRSV